MLGFAKLIQAPIFSYSASVSRTYSETLVGQIEPGFNFCPVLVSKYCNCEFQFPSGCGTLDFTHNRSHMAVGKGKPKDEKRVEKRKRKESNRMMKQNAKYVLAVVGVLFVLLLALVYYWATRPLPVKDA
ncbi:g7481 [Coccomyxa elongata]